MTTTKGETNKSYYLHSAICIIITFGFGFLPEFGGITSLGMDVLGIFIGLLYGWCFIGFIWPSLFSMIALGLTSYGTITAVFSQGFGDSMVVMIFFILIFAGIMDSTGLVEYLANWCVSRKISIDRPWLLSLFILGTSLFLGAFVSLFGAIVIMWYLLYNIFKVAGYKCGDDYVSFMVAGVPFMCTVGSFLFPFTKVSIIYRGAMKGVAFADLVVPMGTLSILQFTICLVTLLCYIGLGKYILHLDVHLLRSLDWQFFEKKSKEKLTKEQKIAAISTLLFIGALIAPSILPSGVLKSFFVNLGVTGSAAVILIVYCFRKNKDGFIYDFGKLVTKGVNWDLIILFAATVPISSALESKDTGIIDGFINCFMPLIESLDPTMFLVVCLVLFFMLTQLAHNLVLGLVFTSVLATMGMKFGLDPFMVQVLFAMVLQYAFITPGGGSSAAMLFGNSQWISKKDYFKYCTIFAIMGLLIILIVGIPLGFLLF